MTYKQSLDDLILKNGDLKTKTYTQSMQLASNQSKLETLKTTIKNQESDLLNWTVLQRKTSDTNTILEQNIKKLEADSKLQQEQIKNQIDSMTNKADSETKSLIKSIEESKI
jgi:hypothetical protein